MSNRINPEQPPSSSPNDLHVIMSKPGDPGSAEAVLDIFTSVSAGKGKCGFMIQGQPAEDGKPAGVVFISLSPQTKMPIPAAKMMLKLLGDAIKEAEGQS